MLVKDFGYRAVGKTPDYCPYFYLYLSVLATLTPKLLSDWMPTPVPTETTGSFFNAGQPGPPGKPQCLTSLNNHQSISTGRDRLRRLSQRLLTSVWHLQCFNAWGGCSQGAKMITCCIYE